jgi:hypothetical protein
MGSPDDFASFDQREGLRGRLRADPKDGVRCYTPAETCSAKSTCRNLRQHGLRWDAAQPIVMRGTTSIYACYVGVQGAGRC